MKERMGEYGYRAKITGGSEKANHQEAFCANSVLTSSAYGVRSFSSPASSRISCSSSNPVSYTHLSLFTIHKNNFRIRQVLHRRNLFRISGLYIEADRVFTVSYTHLLKIPWRRSVSRLQHPRLLQQ